MKQAPSVFRKPLFRIYVLGLLCVVAGAGVTSMVGSMWPLAMGSAVAVMCTARWVSDIRAQAARRRATRPPKAKPP